MKKVRLLTISATAEIGGSDINLLRLLKSLDKNAYEILHLIPYPGTIVDEFTKVGIRLKIVDMPRIRIFKNPLRYIVFILKFFPTVFKIKNIIAENKIDIVCTSTMANLYGVLAAKLAKRPHILLAVEYLPLLRLFSPYFYLFSEQIICCSNLVSRMFKKSDKVLVEYPGVDLDEFNPQINSQNLRKELAVSQNLIGMITRLDIWKGVETFIKAAEYVKEDVKFIIFAQLVMGKERYLEKLQNRIRKLKLEEKVFIKIVRSTPQLIAACDIIVHSSLRPEPFGLIIIEAMAMGKPVIASQEGGPGEIISHGIDGILIEPGNPRVLDKEITRLLEDPETAKEIGRRARQKVEKNFELKEYVISIDRIFKEALKAYSLKQAKVSIGKNMLVKTSVPLVKLWVRAPHRSRALNKDRINNILIIQLFGMGDLVCSLPLLEAFKGYFNKARITLLVDAKLGDVAKLINSEHKIISYEKGILSKLGLLFKIGRMKFDLAVILNPLFQGAWMAYLTGAKYRIGYIRDYENIQNIEKLSGLLTHPILPIDKPMHDRLRYLEIARYLGINLLRLPLQLNIPDTAKEWVVEFLQDNGIREKDFVLGINPNAGWDSRCWEMGKFAEVADIMIERYNTKVILFGSSVASDVDRAQVISALMKHNAISCVAKTDLSKLAGLFNRCNVFLTHDSGPMHLAAALGVNMVVLFGPSDIHKFGYKRENIVNITSDALLFCKPCNLNYLYKNNCADNVCMKGIGSAGVIRSIETLMEQKGCLSDVKVYI